MKNLSFKRLRLAQGHIPKRMARLGSSLGHLRPSPKPLGQLECYWRTLKGKDQQQRHHP